MVAAAGGRTRKLPYGKAADRAAAPPQWSSARHGSQQLSSGYTVGISAFFNDHRMNSPRIGSIAGQAMTSRAKWILAVVIVVVAIGAYLAPLLVTHPEQDTCAFGPVSNARYRELLAEAKRRQATTWPPLVRDDYQAGALLNQRFDDLSRGMTSVYERIAAMHAVVRALGADYRRAVSRGDDPYESTPRGLVIFAYHLDMNRVGLFAPIRRRVLLFGNISAGGLRVAHSTMPHRYERGEISFAALFPKLLEKYQFEPRSELGEACPATPTEEQVPRFTRGD
jgi:hypothetical protein